MRALSHKHLLASALSVLISLALVPAAIADPVSSPATGSGATAPAAVATGVDPSTAGAPVTPDQTAGPPVQADPPEAGSTSVAADPNVQDGSQPAAPVGTGLGVSPQTPSGAASAPGSGQSQSTPGMTGNVGQSSAPAPTPPTSSSATQAIVQVQSLGCTSHCLASSQTQSAQQTDLTVQPAVPSEPAGPTAAPTQSGSQHDSQLVQLQLGCLAHCFGSTTVAGGANGGSGALAQLLNSPGPPVLPDQDSARGAQSGVQQSSSQLEDGLGGVSSQSQLATQLNVSVQDGTLELGSVLSALGFDTGDVAAALQDAAGLLGADASSSPSDPAPSSSTVGTAASSASPVDQAINQVEQVVWQLQIGCLAFCTSTNQSQQAEQSITTVGVVADDANPAPSFVSATASYQLVWQLQVGCLFWCYDAVETQTATILDTVVTAVMPNPPPGPGGSSGAGGTAPAASGAPTPGAGSVTTSLPPRLPMIGPPTPGWIESGPTAATGAEITDVLPNPGRLARSVVPAAALSRSLPAVSPGYGKVLLRTAISNSPAGRSTTVVTGHPPDHPEMTHRRGARRRDATGSKAMPPDLPISSAGTPPWFIAFLAAVALLAMALVISGLRERWAQRPEG